LPASGPLSTSTASVRIGRRVPDNESGDVAIELTRRLYHYALITLALLFGSSIVHAQNGISEAAIDRYDPAPPGDALPWVPDAAIEGNLEIAAGARFSYARLPLVLETPAGSERIVTHQLILHALVAAELARRFELSIDAPFALSQAGAGDSRFASPSGAAMGDLRLGAASELVEARGVLPGGPLALELWLPTGDGEYASSPSPRYGAAAVVGADLDGWLWRARAGARYRRDETEAAGTFGSEVHAGVGVGLVWHKATFGLELVGATGVEPNAGWLSDSATQLEALLSAKYRIGPVTALVGAGPGLSAGAGTPAYRVIAGIEIVHELLPMRSEPDRDGDGVPDRRDACPEEFGAVRGCPAAVVGSEPPASKPSEPQAHFVPGKIVIEKQIHFATGKDEILPESFRILGEVAKLLDEHPEIARVSVDGHTDDVGDDATNLTLSRRRALAVVRWLVQHGIDERRLEARGFGARQPLLEGTTEEARSKNRRVEFWIKRQTELGKRGWRDGAVHD
jgi:outer membrane protein OmpA-like peptidoglycan-associated protein